jgi:hypothetical protein
LIIFLWQIQKEKKLTIKNSIIWCVHLKDDYIICEFLQKDDVNIKITDLLLKYKFDFE